MIRRLALALALLAIPTAAWADWGPTRWGMTLDQVLDSVPGVRPLKREGNGSDTWNQHRLASAPWKDGAIALTADFFFDPDSHTLTLVKMLPTDAGQCPTYQAALVARYGQGTAKENSFPDKGLAFLAIRWTDPKTQERLLYSRMGPIGGSATYCHFIVQKPA